MSSDYRRLLVLAQEVVDDARVVFLRSRHDELTAKGDRDFATETDYEIERTVRRKFELATPDIGFLGEEEGRSGETDRMWCLDPVDGTVNYAREHPLCGISLALLVEETPVLGVVDFPWLGLRYHAATGSGAWRNGSQVFASATKKLCDAVIGMGDYAVGKDAVSKNEARLQLTRQLARSVLRVRMHGSAALDLAWLSDGRLDAAISLSNNPWDVAAGVVLARESGAKVIDLDGSNHSTTSSATVGCAPDLAESIVELLGPVADTGAAGSQ